MVPSVSWACLGFPDIDDIPDDHAMWQCIDEFLDFDAQQGSFACMSWRGMLHAAYPEFACSSLREMLGLLAQRTFVTRERMPGHLRQCVEYFAGKALITHASIQYGLHATRFDKTYSLYQDGTTPSGIRTFFDELAVLGKNALVWLATECSSFTGLCRRQSKREKSNEYIGDLTRAFVQHGNQVAALSSLIFFLAWLVDACPVLEQPVASVMPLMTPLSTVFAYCDSYRTVTWLSAYGAESPKPLQLWHVDSIYASLKRRRPKKPLNSLVTTAPRKSKSHTPNMKGRRTLSFSGVKGSLKMSQIYPYPFAQAVAKLAWSRS